MLFALKIVATVIILIVGVQAHNKMTLPMPSWPDGFYAQNSPSGTIDPFAVLPVPSGMSYNADPASNIKAYWTAFNSSSFKSLKDLVWYAQKLEPGASKECGFSRSDGTARELPDMIQWDFFTISHEGPFEAYCDGSLVVESWNSAIEYPKTPANMPYDKAKCTGSSMLTSYWLAVHTTPWQVYTNCAPLSREPSSTSSSNSSSYSSTLDTIPESNAGVPSVTSASPETSASSAAIDNKTETLQGGEPSVNTEAVEAPTPITFPPRSYKCRMH